jgi:hypothetical protein
MCLVYRQSSSIKFSYPKWQVKDVLGTEAGIVILQGMGYMEKRGRVENARQAF